MNMKKVESFHHRSQKNALAFAFAILFPSSLDRFSIWAIHVVLDELNGALLLGNSILRRCHFLKRAKPSIIETE